MVGVFFLGTWRGTVEARLTAGETHMITTDRQLAQVAATLDELKLMTSLNKQRIEQFNGWHQENK